MKKALIGAEIDKKVLTIRQFVIKNMLCYACMYTESVSRKKRALLYSLTARLMQFSKKIIICRSVKLYWKGFLSGELEKNM